VPISGRVFDEEELELLVESGLDFWLTTGRFADQFEREFAKFMGVREAVLVNSGSSANLLAVSALTSPRLGDRRLRPGDEVITWPQDFLLPSIQSCKIISFPSSSTFRFRHLTWMSLTWKVRSPAERAPSFLRTRSAILSI
jgi:Predicted pyridoxal phosphate-dependent enzyme apparently involved in regulation of cell wall biogenesis